MLRTILATVAALGFTAGAAHAQGAADVGEYHERFALDSDPRERNARSTLGAERRALEAEPLFEPAFEETVIFSRSPTVVSRSPAAIPGRAAGADPALPPQSGLTPGAPLGADPMSDQKAVAGQRLR